MTETANSIINDALLDLKVRSNEAELPAVEVQDMIRAMNRLMSKLAAKGINLGYTRVAKLSDTITIADGALDGLVAMLALRVWPTYREGDPTAMHVENARDGLNAMIELSVTIQPALYPSTLPVGSGNQDVGYESPFYPGVDPDDVLTETNGPILLEDDT